ncbi:predicted protein [Naegleria gruberi]|uniref:Predicted protein n=1 Tax=Naegleria gruberi TaxID=5762 RepID=D2VJR7_NAEGR|nr:uncharacterized protein NAEGRDRAFT_50117 [Naegleria gruberi]EFC42998.1 predicted protein [Naegleria gruberi]|eukprot:XP_002675742.1 predicted protein [Naegleria gruberi strain NEG-M]
MTDRNLHQKDVVMENTSLVEFRLKSIDLLNVEKVKKMNENRNEKVILINDAHQVIGKNVNGKVSYLSEMESLIVRASSWEPIILENWIYATEMYPALDFLWNCERVRCFSVSVNGNISLVTESNSIYIFGNVENFIGKKCEFRGEYERDGLRFVRLRPPKLACTKSQYCENEFSTSNDFQITQIECGISHVIVQCKNRDIYVVGENSAMLIGLEHRSLYRMLTPLRISVLNDLEYVVQIVCLTSCTLFLTSEGRVLFTGSFKSKSNGIEVFKQLVGRVSKISGESSYVAFLMEDNQTICLFNVSLRFGEMIFETNLEKGQIADINCSSSGIEILTSEGDIENICFSHQGMKDMDENYGMIPTKVVPVTVKECYNITPYYFEHTESDLSPIHPCTRIAQFLIYNQTPSYITSIETRNVKYFKENLHSNLKSLLETFSDISLSTI